jgi:hypothetical protein
MCTMWSHCYDFSSLASLPYRLDDGCMHGYSRNLGGYISGLVSL